MSFTEFASMMYPFWILGAIVTLCVLLTSQRYLLRIKKAPLLKWIKWLIIITIVRFASYKMFPQAFHGHTQGAAMIPLGVTFTVWWEDILHGLPLLILRNAIGDKKWLKPFYGIALLATMLDFGLGHIYQSIPAAVLLSLYVPVSVKIGRKHGFGTVAIGHMLYDFFTMIFIKFLIG